MSRSFLSRRCTVSVAGLALTIALAPTAAAQNPVARQMQAQSDAAQTLLGPDAMRVFVCGSASPLGADAKREQACIAVIAGGRLFLVDVGAGANTNLQLGGLPMAGLHTVFLTHFHSDHIASIPDVNLSSWVGGRPRPLVVAGPEGVETVVEGLNLAYGPDRSYRIAHHGKELLPPELGTMMARTIEPGVVLDEEGVRVTAFAVDHAPVDPALGYRFDYGGRSVVVSGDTIRTQSLIEASKGADLLLHDVMAQDVVQMLQSARDQSGDERLSKLLTDVQTYHASTTAVAALAKEAGVRQLVLYHLVPAMPNPMLNGRFLQGMPEGTVLAADGMLFELPTNSDEIQLRQLVQR
ncbi:MAG: MBL fold metallo-hydrolase [Acidobacteriota bacterium]|nr:MBL fold metallo-hydrolase [Acidobacteriota bacterium]